MTSARRLAAALTVLPLASCLLWALPAGAATAPSASPAAASSGARTVFGLSLPNVTGEKRSDTIARTTATFGALPVVRIYADGIPTTWTADRTLAALASTTSVIYTFDVPSMAAAATGSYDTALAAFVRSKPAGIKAWMGLVHEPEGHVERGEFTAEQYRNATGHVARIIKANGGIPTTVLMAGTAFSDGGDGWRDYFSPEIDVLAWNAYNSYQKKPGLLYKAPNKFIDPIVRIAAESGKAFGWAEFGATCVVPDPSCAGRAAWLPQMGAAFAASGAEFVSYWNRESLSGVIDYGLDDAASALAWRNVMAG